MTPLLERPDVRADLIRDANDYRTPLFADDLPGDLTFERWVEDSGCLEADQITIEEAQDVWTESLSLPPVIRKPSPRPAKIGKTKRDPDTQEQKTTRRKYPRAPDNHVWRKHPEYPVEVSAYGMVRWLEDGRGHRAGDWLDVNPNGYGALFYRVWDTGRKKSVWLSPSRALIAAGWIPAPKYHRKKD